MSVLRTVSLAVGLLTGAAFSQLPEFAQQYRQRLGGALDELTAAVKQFDQDATGAGMDRNKAIDTLMHNQEQIARGRGVAIQKTIERQVRLSDQQEKFRDAGPFGRLFAFAYDFDPQLASRAWGDFEPAAPLTAEGAASAGAGLVAGYGLTQLIAAPFRRRRRTAAVAAAR